MNFKITQHYARGEEKLIAEFNELDEAKVFITKKSLTDEEERKKVIYRVYDDHELLIKLNKENLCVTHAKYAEGSADFHNSELIYHVFIKSIDSSERKEVAQFNDRNNARLFVFVIFETACELNESNLFLIFKNNILIDTLNKNTIANQQGASGSSSNEKGATYRLSPLSTRPTPGGGPADYWVEDKDDN
ncbi:hypothetical protein Lmor_0527 [Legionella moravica]|uniref:Uncharacterized protein n=1 Tax=Legionella moravica TaxID=39962 RepID=A0A378JUK0_9GAMM|nr:hypothetical protein [Legionella moravica]KTD37664.1 hypothetical protein Lmor_0527 [Legionella moravica]STX61690.1 Uncharacterised protein [Legionella moravica]HEN5528829.1 hypothetical protein [Legionella pneumophila]